MNYGKSKHYTGEQGAKYFDYQNRFAELGAKLNAKKFSDHVKPNDRVLDFGCGGGWLLKELKCQSRVGVELNENAHSICHQNGVIVYKSIAEVKEPPFDVVITHHCLEHVPYPIEALRELRSKLAQNGRLLLVVPIDDWRVDKDFRKADINHHLHTWTPRLLANSLVEAGYKIDTISVLTHAWFPGWARFYGSTPDSIFNVACCLWSLLRKRRQLYAIAFNE